MNLTKEQQLIINSTGNLKINAVAGAGKTTTIIEYAKSRPKPAKILYLAFNKSAKIEAEKKFQDSGLEFVDIETAHSLAHRHTIKKYRLTVKAKSYTSDEIVEILKIQCERKHDEFIIANHVNKFVTYFCNSNKQKVEELNYRDVVFDQSAKAFVGKHYKDIEIYTRRFLAKMQNGEIEVIHDFYLKRFQLDCPILRYDYFLFDEGQDASPAILDVFLRQNCTKVIVGDIHQQIYSWRYAINSLQQVDFPTLNLSTSFRFGSEIASLANEVINWKNHLDPIASITVSGENKENKKAVPKTILARTNLGLFLRAIEYVSSNRRNKSLYFEGNLNSYTYAEQGTSLYDVLNLQNGKRNRIRSKLIASMKNMGELKKYVDQTEDLQLATMITIVEKYGNQLFELIRLLRHLHVPDHAKSQADMIFSTVHKSKGMEYDAVELAEDFMSEKDLLDRIKTSKPEELDKKRLNEEVNLLYVALTRAKVSVYVPNSILPVNYKGSNNVIAIKSTEASTVNSRKSELKSDFSVLEQDEEENLVLTSPTPDSPEGRIVECHSRGFSTKDIALILNMELNFVRRVVEELGLTSKKKFG